MQDYARFKYINDLLDAGRPELARELLRGLQASFIALRDEVDRLQARIGSFESLLAIPSALVEDDGLVWLETETGRQGPFCPGCHEAEGSLILLGKTAAGWRCPCCSQELPLHPGGRGQARVLRFVPGRHGADARADPR